MTQFHFFLWLEPVPFQTADSLPGAQAGPYGSPSIVSSFDLLFLFLSRYCTILKDTDNFISQQG